MKDSKILIIEDDRSLISILKEALRNENSEVFVAIDGKEGLKKAISEQPDLILLDILLPGESGFDILEKLKVNPLTKKIPVIILSNLGAEQEIRTGTILGAEDYLIKADLTITQVIKKIMEILKKK